MLETDDYKVERVREPSGIVVPDPELTWALRSDRNGDRQTACEIEVDHVAPGGETRAAWRSGKQPAQIGDELRYAGAELKSRTPYRWRVRVWDVADEPSGWSDWQPFETGIIAPDRLGGEWIGGGGALRRTVHVEDGLVRARAYVAGVGYYEFFCNRRKVSAAALAPSFTEFEQRVEYETIDLTPHLAPGANAIGFLLADGWWRHGREACQTRNNQAIADLVLEYADGRRATLHTDATWQAAPGPLAPEESTRGQQVFDGVTLDLGWLASGWCEAAASADGWAPARVMDGPGGRLTPTLLPPVTPIATLKPRAVTRRSDTLLSVDFGQNFTGWVRFRAQGSRGTRLVVRHAELLHPDGRLNPDTLRSARQTDTFRLGGALDGETVEPRFLYHGLRYAEIEAPCDAVDTATIEGVVVHSALEPVGEVHTGDDRLDWLLDAVRWTVRSNAMSVMTDVCQRDERRGWLMDGVTGLKAGLLFYDMDALARKWVEDMIDNQVPDGSLRGDTAPLWFACKSVGWQRAIVLVPTAMYEAVGDRSLLRKAFPHMRRYADYLLANLRDDLLPDGFSRHPSEWLCIGKRNRQLGDNAMAADVLRKVARAAQVVSESGGEQYAEAADRIAAAARRRWSAPDGCFGGNGGEAFAQSNQVYALRFDLAASESRQKVFDRLVDDILNARGAEPFVTTGIGSTEHLPMVLSAFGRDDIVWRWLQRDAYPGYGFMHRQGATAIWECWDRRIEHGMNAHNHTGLSGIGTWLRHHLVGIAVEPGSEPVFHLRPALTLPLTHMTSRRESRWGTVRMDWESTADGHRLNVALPPGCRGMLNLPGTAEPRPLASGTHVIRLPHKAVNKMTSEAVKRVYILTAPERTPEEIDAAYAEIPPVRYMPPPDRWRRLRRTADILAGGQPMLRVVMLGDSLIGDTSRSEWDIVLQRRYPACRIMKVTVIRGSTGCWWYREENRVHTLVYPHRPDLLMIGGISQNNDVDSIRDVIRQARALHPCDVLLMSGPFGRTDPRRDEEWSFELPADSTCYRRRLKALADAEEAGFLDMTAHWGRYIRESGRELDWFKRDAVHANAHGEQIAGRILAAHLAPPVEGSR